MRYLVVSDIHANLEALEAVMAAAGPLGFDRALVLGDLVGYGADPNAVIDKVREMAPHALIRGNHDKVGSGIESAEGFNAVARSAIHWTLDALTAENRAWLAALPAGPVQVDDLIEICHGTPFDEDAYVFRRSRRAPRVARRQAALCLFGHTHVQVGYSIVATSSRWKTASDARPRWRSTADPLPDQPGLSGPAARRRPARGFAMVDTDARRSPSTAFPTPSPAQSRILEEGLPEILAERLGVGR
jgi:predicted phosphodiesterase